MKAQKLSPLDCLEVPPIASPKWEYIHSAGQLTIDDEETNQHIKRKLENIYVRSGKDDENKMEITKNNEFIEPSEKFKRSHFLLMDFSGLGCYKN